MVVWDDLRLYIGMRHYDATPQHRLVATLLHWHFGAEGVEGGRDLVKAYILSDCSAASHYLLAYSLLVNVGGVYIDDFCSLNSTWHCVF
jgi:hypothetical protein